MIKGEGYIASHDFGFRERKVVNGRVVPGKVLITDLKMQFSVEHIYKVVKDSDQVIVYKDAHWSYMADRELKAWCMARVEPDPSVNDMNEFVGSLKAHNIVSLDEMHNSKDGFINFSNTVLNLRTGDTHQHSPDFGFFDVRPYAYDPRATAPTWDKFLLDIMGNDTEKAQLLKEYAGYCISNDYPWLQKAAMLYGAGSNGKSVFIETLGEVVGEKAHSAIPMQELSKDTMRNYIVNKLFNYSEETSVKAFNDSSVFKTITAGGVISVKQLYVQPYTVKVRTKLIMSCNELPQTMDSSHGFLRRFVIIGFNERFTPGDGRHDPLLRQKLMQELPGICNSIIKAYNECKMRGQLIQVESVEDELVQYQDALDTIKMFHDEVLVPSEGTEVKIAEVYSEYAMMCQMKGLKPKTAPWFGRDLKKFTKQDVSFKSDNGKSYRVLKGYRIDKDY